MRKITEKEFQERFSMREDSEEYQYNNDYNGWNNYIILIHKKCKKEYKVTPYSLCIKNSRCPYCVHQKIGYNKRLKKEDVLQKFEQESKGEYELLSEYQGINSQVTLKHLKCGQTYTTNLSSFIKGARCKCNSNLRTITEQEAKNFLEKGFSNIQLISTYNGWRNINKFKCNKCGSVFEKRFSSLKKQKFGCKKCYNISRIGEGNPEWKGGDSEFIRSMRKLIQPWKFASAKFYNHRCIITGKSGGNEIHHLNKNFMEILEECLDELKLERKEKISDYSKDKYKELAKLLVKKHQENGYGIVINKKLHRQFHYKYGFKHNSFEQFQEFCKEYQIDIVLKDNICYKLSND